MTTDQDWVQAAMSDDAMVVDLLVRLHHAPPPPPPRKPAAAAFPLEWTVRQRRSKPVSVKPAHRASPTTPLSWSGATSLSGGSEESSRPIPFKLSGTTRSKFSVDIEKTALKRPRKKKSLAQLKDEENSLLKERRDLKREMVALRVNLEKQRATNENLKRMKIEKIRPSLDRGTRSIPEESTSGQLPIMLQSSILNGCTKRCANESSESKLILPDLNMPFDDDVICGVS